MLPLIPIAGSLIASLVPELFKLFGTEKQAQVAEEVINIAKKVTGIEDGDEAAKAIMANPELALQFKTAVLNQEVQLKEIAYKTEKLYVDDVQDARKYRDANVFRLGVVILCSFAAVMGVTLYGLYKLTTGTVPVDQNTFAAVVGLVGAIIGYFAANAQQVVSYFFGSSQGSMMKSDNITDTISKFKREK